jgi:hypothetical protein
MGQVNVNTPGDGDGRGTGAGFLVGILVAIVVIILLVYFLVFNKPSGGTTTPTNGGTVPSAVVLHLYG